MRFIFALFPTHFVNVIYNIKVLVFSRNLYQYTFASYTVGNPQDNYQVRVETVFHLVTKIVDYKLDRTFLSRCFLILRQSVL